MLAEVVHPEVVAALRGGEVVELLPVGAHDEVAERGRAWGEAHGAQVEVVPLQKGLLLGRGTGLGLGLRARAVALSLGTLLLLLLVELLLLLAAQVLLVGSAVEEDHHHVGLRAPGGMVAHAVALGQVDQ